MEHHILWRLAERGDSPSSVIFVARFPEKCWAVHMGHRWTILDLTT